MSVFSKIRGTVETMWQIGLGGPNFKNNSGVMETRNAGDMDYANFRAEEFVLGDGSSFRQLGANTLEARNDAGSGFATLSVAAPSAGDHAANKTYVDAQSPDVSALKVVRFSITQSGGATQDSTFQIPANSRVLKAVVNVTTAFDGTTPTVDVGNTVTADLFFDNTELDEATINYYSKDQDTDSGVLSVVRASVSAGGGTLGVADVIVHYVETPST